LVWTQANQRGKTPVMDQKSITGQAEQYVRDYFDLHPNSKLLYHNLYHTERVVKAARQIGQHYQLGDTDQLIVTVAAWFHDLGYLQGGAAGHEERGAQMAVDFLQGKAVDTTTVEGVRSCILATRLPQRAESLLEQIVCDADLFHLGTDEFGGRNKLMRKEAEEVKGEKISKDEWRKSTIQLLGGHQYFTEYCRNLLGGKQRENLEVLRHKQVEHHKQEEHHNQDDHHKQDDHHRGDGGQGVGMSPAPVAPIGGVAGTGGVRGGGLFGGKDGGADKLENILHRHLQEVDAENTTAAPVGKKVKEKDPGRSIDTVFRITSNNNQRLSSQADSKAHILIQVNAIIISVLLSLLLRKIEDHTNLVVPATLLLTVNLVTIIFSILATRPHIPPGRFTKADLDEKRVNLLFFGNFYRMSLEEYAGGMLQMMEDRDFLYGSLIRDVYFQGIALGRKYRWLRWSYNVFMYGLIISVTAFMVAALAFPPK
jgi:predicted metal-dependent HD superfamily phosphohydrolase